MKKDKAYCAFCKSPHWVYRKRHAQFVNWMLAGVMSLLTGFVLYQDLDLRSVMFLGIYIAMAEAFIHLRWRLSVLCHECGFDPFLYKKSPHQAAQKVKYTLEQREKKPENYLKPPLKIPVRVVMANKTSLYLPNASEEVKRIRRLNLKASGKRGVREARTADLDLGNSKLETSISQGKGINAKSGLVGVSAGAISS